MRVTAAEVAVLVLLAAAVVALVLVFAPTRTESGPPSVIWGGGRFDATKTECMNNVRHLVALLTIAHDLPTKYGGVNLMLQLIKRGTLEGEDSLRILFCPGDKTDTWDAAGGIDAYGATLDVTKKGEYDHLSSYAGRDQTNMQCRASSGQSKMVILVCDDSEDHHGGRGFVVGFTGGAVKFRHKVNCWNIDMKTSVQIGEGSAIKELECMRAD